MNEDHETARRYRQRAEEVRTIAGDMRDRTSRQILVDIADDYERMAVIMDGIAASDRKRALPFAL